MINRIKPHTDYHGRYEIGLGKHAQALEIHRHGIHGLKELMHRAAERLLANRQNLF